MANTVTQKTLHGDATSRRVIRSIHVASDGTEETGTIIYNNSDFVANTAIGRLMSVRVLGSFTGTIALAWDQTTDENIVSIGQSNSGFHDFSSFGGYRNPNGTGATGDILLTSRALANLDDFTVIIDVIQD
jgi:hypothetical protein